MRFRFLAAILFAAAPSSAQQPDVWQIKAREFLARSVGFKSSEKQGETPKLVSYLQDEFRKAGVAAGQMTVVPVGKTQALVVRLAGRDRTVKPILFSSHMDVVEADPKDWARDPFTFIEEDGYFLGRGVLDDKAGVAQLATLIVRLTSQKLTPSRDLVFAFIGDEETAMRTTAELAGPRKALIDAEFALNADAGGGDLGDDGRPQAYFIQGGEKTYADYTLTVVNPGGHSSAPKPDNAIYRLAAALARVQQHRFPVMANALTRSAFAAEAKVAGPDWGPVMADFARNPVDGPAAAKLSSNPYIVGQLRTTCVATMLKGGHAPNALPQRAEANVNCRIFPGVGVEVVRRELERVVADPQVRVTADTSGAVADSPTSEPRPDVTAAVTKAIRQEWGPVDVAYSQTSGATDGSHYRAAGIPTYGVTFLYMKEGEGNAHGLNEKVPVQSFERATRSWWSLVQTLADPR